MSGIVLVMGVRTNMGKTALSTASFCLWPITAERKVEICRDFKFSRIEIAIPHIKMVIKLFRFRSAVS